MDVDRLLNEISPDAPSGEKDVEYDPVFINLMKETERRVDVDNPDRERGMIEDRKVNEAKAPILSWSDIKDAAYDLLTRTHDLRLAITLLQALMHTEGWHGVRCGLELLHRLNDRFWDTLHPQLDPEEDYDPTPRINILLALSDWETIIHPLIRITICESRSLGSYSLRDLLLSTGKMTPTEKGAGEVLANQGLSTIEAACLDSDQEQLKANQEAVQASQISLNSLDNVLAEKVGIQNSPDFRRLRNMLDDLNDFLIKQLDRNNHHGSPEAEPQAENAVDEAIDDTPAEPSVFIRVEKTMETINDRQDVISVLEQVCAYYERHEPASPVPLLLKRAMRLVDKDFMEIMQDLAPDSIDKIQTITGSRDDRS